MWSEETQQYLLLGSTPEATNVGSPFWTNVSCYFAFNRELKLVYQNLFDSWKSLPRLESALWHLGVMRRGICFFINHKYPTRSTLRHEQTTHICCFINYNISLPLIVLFRFFLGEMRDYLMHHRHHQPNSGTFQGHRRVNVHLVDPLQISMVDVFLIVFGNQFAIIIITIKKKNRPQNQGNKVCSANICPPDGGAVVLY